MYKFDFKSGYHHIDIYQAHTQFLISSDLSGVALIVIFVSPSCLLGSSLPLSFHQNFPWSSSFLERIGHPCRVVFG